VSRTSAGRLDRTLGSFGIPLFYALASITLGFAVPRLEATYLPGLSAHVGVPAALAVLSAIASGMMPLTGLVFSLAFVMVQFSATAYSPRLVGWIAAGSTIMSHSLGIFTATFVYALAALAWVDRNGNGSVPLLTVWVAIFLLLASIVVFTLLVDRLGMLQISRVLQFIGDQGRSVIERDHELLAENESVDPARRIGPLPAPGQVLVYQGAPRVIQALDVRRLVGLAARRDVIVSMALGVGDTVVDGMPLLAVHGGSGKALRERSLRRCFRFGSERTFEQDAKYAIRLLVDIAIKALSPAINDPTTAVQALDQIEDLLTRLGQRSLAAGSARDKTGVVRLVHPAARWEDFLALALNEIRFYGEGSIQVIRRLRALLRDLMSHVPVERLAPLERYLERVDLGIERAFPDADDRKDALAADRQGLGLARDPLPPGGAPA
jgi:uncharacterized membrane protein